MSAEISIRPLEESDKGDWHRMWTAYLEFYETSVSEDVYETSFARLLSNGAGEYKCLIAEVDGKPVGLAHFLYYRFMWLVEDTCYLMDLFTDPGMRGNGLRLAQLRKLAGSRRENCDRAGQRRLEADARGV